MAGLERVVDLGRIEQMMLRLPDLVASPLSVNSLRGDLQVSHKQAEHWLQILERCTPSSGCRLSAPPRFAL